MLSAYDTEKRTKAVNEKLNAELYERIKSLGTIELSHGWWQGTPEESFFLVTSGNITDVLLDIVKDYDQAAILVKPVGSFEAHNVYKGGKKEDLGTFEKMTPEQAANVDFKSQPHGVTDWYWRYTKTPFNVTSENSINETSNVLPTTWKALADEYNIQQKGRRFDISDFDGLVSKGIAVREIAILLANNIFKHLKATWDTIGSDDVDMASYLKRSYPTVRDMLVDVKNACLDKINSDMPDEYNVNEF
jgi:hypothetical protein